MTTLTNEQLIQAWKLLVKHGPPPCCETCYYHKGNHCGFYDMQPPDEFKTDVGKCEFWMQEEAGELITINEFI